MVPVYTLDLRSLGCVSARDGNRVLVADLGGKRDDDDRQVSGMSLDYAASIRHAGLVVERADAWKLSNGLQPKPNEFATLR